MAKNDEICYVKIIFKWKPPGVVANNEHHKLYFLIYIFCCSPSGSQILIVGLLQGLAGGTLLYVTFFEVLEREKLDKIGMTGLMGCFLIILGFGLMSGLEAAGN